MNLIIKEDTFDITKVRLKRNNTSIKLVYDLGYIELIGIPLRVHDYKYVSNKGFIKILLNDDRLLSILRSIDKLLSHNRENYQSFIRNQMINVKDVSNKGVNPNEIYICLSSVKLYNKHQQVQIFTI